MFLFWLPLQSKFLASPGKSYDEKVYKFSEDKILNFCDIIVYIMENNNLIWNIDLFKTFVLMQKKQITTL